MLHVFFGMKRIRRHTIELISAGLVMVLLWGSAPAVANTGGPEQGIFDLINRYREAPYAHAVAMGYDPVVLQERGILPDTRFNPYLPALDLTAAAVLNNDRTTARDTPVAHSFTPRQHMRETGSVLTFTHFMPADTAGSHFVTNLFKSELNTGDFQYILSDAFTHAGVAVAAGAVAGRNAWFISLVIGSDVRTSDMQMLNLINQIRSKPALVADYLPDALPDLARQNPVIYHLPNMQLSPVFFDGFLHECAATDAEEAADPGEPALDPGNDWPGEFFHTITAAAFWENMAEARPVTDLFSGLLLSELSTWPHGSVIFSNRYQEAGAFVSLIPGEPVDDTDTFPIIPVQSGNGVVSVCAGSSVPATVLETTGPVAPPAGRIYGVLFEDHDDNSVYAVGEELSGEIVTVYDEHLNPVAEIVTDNAGHFSLTLETGRYWIFEAWIEDRVSRRIIHIDGDRFVKMGFTPLSILH